MAIHFNLKSRPQPAGRSRSGDNSASAVSLLSAKAAEMVERARLTAAISDLEEEIALQMQSIGELVYATHCGNPSDSDEMQNILSYVDDLRDQIEGHEQQLRLLSGSFCCSVCGEAITEEDTCCRKCGHPLSESLSNQS